MVCSFVSTKFSSCPVPCESFSALWTKIKSYCCSCSLCMSIASFELEIHTDSNEKHLKEFCEFKAGNCLWLTVVVCIAALRLFFSRKNWVVFLIWRWRVAVISSFPLFPGFSQSCSYNDGKSRLSTQNWASICIAKTLITLKTVGFVRHLGFRHQHTNHQLVGLV